MNFLWDRNWDGLKVGGRWQERKKESERLGGTERWRGQKCTGAMVTCRWREKRARGVEGLKLSCEIDRYSERGGDGERWRELGERNKFVEGEETRRISDTMRERAKRKSSNFYHCWCKEGYICQEKKRIYEMTFRNGKSKIFCKPVSWRKYRKRSSLRKYIYGILCHTSLYTFS